MKKSRMKARESGRTGKTEESGEDRPGRVELVGRLGFLGEKLDR